MVGPERFSKVALYIALAAALLGLIVLPSEAATEPPRALLTIADGPVELLRGATRHDAVEGLALGDNDIVRTAGRTRVARIEFADGRVLDLGPGTQVLLLSDGAAAAQGLGGDTVAMVQGWAKLSVSAVVNAGVGAGARLATLRLGVTVPPAGSVLLHVEPDGDALVFAEARGATVWRRPGAGQVTAVEATLREGDAWSRLAGAAAGTVSVGAATPALKSVPRALADALPRRAAHFAGRTIEATPGEAIDPRELVAVRREWAPPRKPSTTASAPPRPVAARAAREPKLIAGLALRADPAPSSMPSIALEPTPLLAAERVQVVLSPVAIAAVAVAEPAPPRPVAARPARPAPSSPTPTAAAAPAEAPRRR